MLAGKTETFVQNKWSIFLNPSSVLLSKYVIFQNIVPPLLIMGSVVREADPEEELEVRRLTGE